MIQKTAFFHNLQKNTTIFKTMLTKYQENVKPDLKKLELF